MKALRSFSVHPKLPPQLAALEGLAMNLRWSWDERTRDLFRWVDPDAWQATQHDPVRLLGLVTPERLQALAKDRGFRAYLDEIEAELARYLSLPRWFQSRTDSQLRLVGYFSPEFGISEALPQYSGGLGVLAGDHLKAASDLGVPLVGVGLLYGHGYFRQSLNLSGWQQERYPELDPYAMALRLCDDVTITLDLGGETCTCQVWRADVGRTALFLLDTDVEANPPELRTVTDRLYGGDTEHRLRQEMVLGIGGVRALQALGREVQVFHTNEGHAGFLGLERIRQLVQAGDLTFTEALEATRAGNIFTTHTPVPAGIDRFPRELMKSYFDGFADELGISFDDLMLLGQRDDEPDETRFNMAVMGLRLAARANGVAQLHGQVSRKMFAALWPDVPVDEVPITSITNGVHAPTWVAPEVDALLSRAVLPDWVDADGADWARVGEVRDDELWRAKEQGRERLVTFVRQRLRAARLAQGASVSDVAWCDTLLDPGVLTVGFARRFATYKRATLLLSRPERLKRMLLAPDRPVQFVFAGKAHPADDAGKAMIQHIEGFARDPHVRHRFVFIDDYDISVARALIQGCDVWLNTPRRPQEASGTSGMKAALNGSLNVSILDGWWDEWFDGANGWAISSVEDEDDLERRDEHEAASLFDLLEQQIVPLFYARTEGPVPRPWTGRVKHTLASLGPKVTASRMVRDYVTQLYEPAAAQAIRIAADGYAPARELSAWKRRLLAGWDDVTFVSVASDGGSVELGSERHVVAQLHLGSLTADDVEVQLLHGPAGAGDELVEPVVVPLTCVGPDDDGLTRYEGTFRCERAGRYGFTARAVPHHPGLTCPVELGRIAWA